MPKVSVIVPVYNVENYIERCLESLVNQTLQDIEIIVVNDGSTDNSESIIKRYLEKFNSKIKYFYKTNGGLSDARNYGMKYATSDYIAFLDSDDYVDVTMYEKLYNKAISENYDLVECDFIWKYENKQIKDNGYIYKDKYEMIVNARVVAWNKLIKRSLITENKIQFPKGFRYEDVEFFYKLLPYIKKFGFVKEFLIYYVQREDSIVKAQDERTRDIFLVLDNVIKYYKEKDFYDEYKEQLEYTYIRLLLCSSLLRIVKIKDKMIRKEQINTTWRNLNVNFPKWKKNKILLENNNAKNLYMRSVNKYTIKLYSLIFRLKK